MYVPQHFNFNPSSTPAKTKETNGRLQIDPERGSKKSLEVGPTSWKLQKKKNKQKNKTKQNQKKKPVKLAVIAEEQLLKLGPNLQKMQQKKSKI